MNTNTMTTTPLISLPLAGLGEWFTALGVDTQLDIAEMVNERGYPLDDIRDFVEQYGEQAYCDGHYVTWCELTEQTGADNEAIEAYADVVGIDNIGGFEDAYYGEFDSEAEFAEEYYTNIMCYRDIEQAMERGIVVDWQATWDTNLQHDFAYNNGYVFNTNM